MLNDTISPENTVFVLLAFEGPDSYSLAGGLGVRMSMLSDALSRLGFQTHLIFIGDPRLYGHEKRPGQSLHLHRWCQWISAHHPLARVLYSASDGVLANSSHEPFGLVGLEAMAAGGVSFVGETEEDYAQEDA